VLDIANESDYYPHYKKIFTDVLWPLARVCQLNMAYYYSSEPGYRMLDFVVRPSRDENGRIVYSNKEVDGKITKGIVGVTDVQRYRSLVEDGEDVTQDLIASYNSTTDLTAEEIGSALPAQQLLHQLCGYMLDESCPCAYASVICNRYNYMVQLTRGPKAGEYVMRVSDSYGLDTCILKVHWALLVFASSDAARLPPATSLSTSAKKRILYKASSDLGVHLLYDSPISIKTGQSGSA
jgi:hypothetical protein